MNIVDALSNGLGLQASGITDVEESIIEAMKNTQGAETAEEKVLLVLDGLDFLLAATAFPVQDVIDMVTNLREVIHKHSPFQILS